MSCPVQIASQMKLEKVEELTNILVERGYIAELLSLQFRAEF